MNPHRTALILIGFQNDYFASDGILRTVIEEAARVSGVLENTLSLLTQLVPTPVLIVSTPITFTHDYRELKHPVGILKTIQEVHAFQAGTPGAAMVPELAAYADRILEIPGKRGLNAFSNTQLGQLLDDHQVTDVVLAGVVTSICIDSTGRSAHERGHRVAVLSDCTCGRTIEEQEFYCQQIFPLYARVVTRAELIHDLGS